MYQLRNNHYSVRNTVEQLGWTILDWSIKKWLDLLSTRGLDSEYLTYNMILIVAMFIKSVACHYLWLRDSG